MTAYRSDELVSSSDFAKKFGSYLSQIREHTVDKLAILKNNKVEAVLVSHADYEQMQAALKELESKEFISTVSNGLEDIKEGKTHHIDTLWDALDD